MLLDSIETSETSPQRASSSLFRLPNPFAGSPEIHADRVSRRGVGPSQCDTIGLLASVPEFRPARRDGTPEQRKFLMAAHILSARCRLRALLPLLIGVSFFLVASQRPEEAGSLSEQARRINQSAIVIDTHVDTLQRILIGNTSITNRLPDGQVDIPRMREGGVKGEFFSVWIDSVYSGDSATRRTLQLIDAMYGTIAANPKDMELARDAADIVRISRTGRIAALMGIEGGHAIHADLGVLRMFHQLGVRYMTLTWANSNEWAGSSGDAGRERGLTDFGRDVVREMNRIGMIVDISHVSDKTFWDVMAVATKPVIASHSSCRALCDVPRNMTDDMLRAVARNGGVVGINFNSGFIDPEYNKRATASGQSPLAALTLDKFGGDVDKLAAARYQIFETSDPTPRPPFEKLIDHIDHAVKVAGVDHVGIGSDFDGVSSVPAGMEDISKLPAITEALLRKGYSESDVRKILGGNFLRVLREVTER